MSAIHHFKGDQTSGSYHWEGVQEEEINTEDVQGVLKHVLVGPSDGAPNFIMRYFQVPVGGHTFYHEHTHEHGMLILHGQAKLQINRDFFVLSALDAMFVSGGDLHQLTNIGEQPLGFLCIIPRLEA